MSLGVACNWPARFVLLFRVVSAWSALDDTSWFQAQVGSQLIAGLPGLVYSSDRVIEGFPGTFFLSGTERDTVSDGTRGNSTRRLLYLRRLGEPFAMSHIYCKRSFTSKVGSLLG